MTTSSGSKIRSASSSACSGSASPRWPRAREPGVGEWRRATPRAASPASAWRRSRSDVSQCSSRVRARAGRDDQDLAPVARPVADLVDDPVRGAGLVGDHEDPAGCSPAMPGDAVMCRM